ncbi:MAG TPA: FHA domain-containing protein, partial [Longimicrobium sp.]|nr:FHA domain-containing protein [Longimicrobium sp.]
MGLHPRLIGVSGPLEGRTFPLAGESFVIGRHAESQLQVLELSVSRRHCELRPDGELRWVLRDLGSASGTFVNSRPIAEHLLAHGDLVQVGTTCLVFLLYDSVEEQAAPAVELMAHSTVAKRLEEGVYLKPGHARDAAGEANSAAADLSALLRLCASVQ